MHETTRQGRKRLVAAFLALSALAVALIVMPVRVGAEDTRQPHGGETGCAGATLSVNRASARELRRAVRCLVNVERRARELSRMGKVPSLRRVAQRHSRVMVETDCLDHRCEGEPSLRKRLGRAGYFDAAEAWEYAENTGCAPTAAAMVLGWMQSREHRRYIVAADFHEIGVGVAHAPADSHCEDDYATFAVVVGWRELGY